MNVAGRGRGPGSQIAGSVRHKIPIGGSGFAGTFRDTAFNGYEYGKTVATNEDFKAWEPKICTTLTSDRLSAAMKEREREESEKTDLKRLLESTSAPDLKTVKLQFDWQDSFQQKDFLIPPNNTGYRPLWTFDFGRPTVDLRAVQLETKWHAKPQRRLRGALDGKNDPYWMGPEPESVFARWRTARPLSPEKREAETRTVINLPPL